MYPQENGKSKLENPQNSCTLEAKHPKAREREGIA